MTDASRYPLATATLQRLLHSDSTADVSPLAAFRLGPAVLRAPPAVRAGRAADGATASVGHDDEDDADSDLLGELVDMVLVGADDSDSRVPEVHLQFKAEVFGGLHLRLQKAPEGLVAAFTVADASARRAVAAHIDALIARLRERGFAVIRHSIDVAGG